MTRTARPAVCTAVERLATRLLQDCPSREVASVVQEATCRVYRHLGDRLVPAGEDGGRPVDLAGDLGRLHEALLERRPVWDGCTLRLVDGGTTRKSTGSYFTPPALVEHLLDEALEPALREAETAGTAAAAGAAGAAGAILQVKVLDPACGAGIFLVAAARRMARRLAHARCSEPTAGQVRQAHRDVLERCVYGVDRDPAVVELARIALWHDLGESEVPRPTPRLVVADALLDDWHGRMGDAVTASGGFDVVVGNPPFLNQLETLTALGSGDAAAVAARSGSTVRAYTDLSAVFLQRSWGWVRPGGRVALVQPQSLLAARDAGAVRSQLAAGASLESLWATDQPVFDAHVLTCAPVLRRGVPQGAVRRTHGRDFRAVAPYPAPDLTHEWSFLLAAGLGVPEVRLSARCGTLGDLAECTADFRDQYYGLAPYVHEAADCPAGVPLITTGLIEPAACLWGRREARFLKRRWAAPVIDVAALGADPALGRWAAARMVPKVLLATQGSVLEAVVDAEGSWLPSVPTVTVAAAAEHLWLVLAVLLSPPVTAYAAARYAGTALTMRAIKLSARQVGRLPLPVDRAAWEHGAALALRAQTDSEGPPDLTELGRTMCAAYEVRDPAVMEWWLRRA